MRPHHGALAPGPRVERGSQVLEARLLPEHPANKKAAGSFSCGLCLASQLPGGVLHAATSQDKDRRAIRVWAAERKCIHRQLDTPGPPGIPQRGY